MRRRIASVFMSLLLISSALVGATGSASASPWTEGVTCNSDSLWSALTSPLTETCDLGTNVPEDLNETDANETKSSLYGSLSGSEAAARTSNDSMHNTLEMTETVALMESKNAYIRALENGSTEAEARLAAHDAADEFWATHETQIYNRWELQATELERAYGHAEDDSGVNAGEFLRANITWDQSGGYGVQDRDTQFQTTSVPLSNGSTMEVTALNVSGETMNDGGSGTYRVYKVIKPTTTDKVMIAIDDPKPGIETHGYEVSKPYAQYSGDGFTYLKFGPSNPYATQLAEVDSQRSSVSAEINTFVNNTYDQYEEGEINSSDLVDPYVASRNYSPEDDYQTWALATLQTTGQQMPSNISQFGEMNVTDLQTGDSHTGILLSDGLPESGGFDVGSTYHADNLTGPQYVLKNDTIHKLDGEFRVESATGSSGEEKDSVEYTTVDYQTTNLTEYKAQMAELEKGIDEINARQDALRSGGAGGFLPDMGGSTGMLLLVGAGAAAALYLKEDN